MHVCIKRLLLALSPYANWRVCVCVQRRSEREQNRQREMREGLGTGLGEEREKGGLKRD